MCICNNNFFFKKLKAALVATCSTKILLIDANPMHHQLLSNDDVQNFTAHSQVDNHTVVIVRNLTAADVLSVSLPCNREEFMNSVVSKFNAFAHIYAKEIADIMITDDVNVLIVFFITDNIEHWLGILSAAMMPGTPTATATAAASFLGGCLATFTSSVVKNSANCIVKLLATSACTTDAAAALRGQLRFSMCIPFPMVEMTHEAFYAASISMIPNEALGDEPREVLVKKVLTYCLIEYHNCRNVDNNSLPFQLFYKELLDAWMLI